MSRSLTMPVLLVLALSIPIATQADGIIQKLPADGAWSKYDIEIQGAEAGSFTVRSVGRDKFEDEMCRWIELEFRFTRENEKDQVLMYQLVIPEKNLVGGDNPLDHIAKGWQKYPNDPRSIPGVIIDLDLLRRGTFSRVLYGLQDDATPLEPSRVQSKAGDFKNCEGGSCSQVLTLGKQPNQFQDLYRYEARHHADAPFGVVEFKSEFRRKLTNGQFTPPRIWNLRLVQSGHGAVSSLTEAEKQNNPRGR